MRKNILIVCVLISALLLAACQAPATTEDKTDTTTDTTTSDGEAMADEKPIVPEPNVEEQPATEEDYGITSDTRAKLDEKFDKVTKFAVSETFKKVSVGDHHTFALGITNRLTGADDFLVTFDFKEAKDSRSNPLDGVDAQQIKPWLSRNDLGQNFLDRGEQWVLPLVVEVTEFADGSTPPSGNYVFAVEVFYQDGSTRPDEFEYAGPQDIVVQVV